MINSLCTSKYSVNPSLRSLHEAGEGDLRHLDLMLNLDVRRRHIAMVIEIEE